MRCILEGHTFRRYPGHGEHAGRQFNICVECGKTVPVNEGERDADPQSAQSGEAGARETGTGQNR